MAWLGMATAFGVCIAYTRPLWHRIMHMRDEKDEGMKLDKNTVGAT